MSCRVCRSTTSLFDSATVLGKYPAKYDCCSGCGLVQIENPTWLDEAYQSPLASTDVGQVDRAAGHAARLAALLRLSRLSGTFLDYGGGSGLLVRMMRDRGFDFRWLDPMAENQFAVGHQGSLDQRYEVVSLIEVLEHLVDPLDILGQLAAVTDTIYVSTVLLPDPAPEVGEWWYYSPETGQHITFFTRRSFELIGEEFGMSYVGRGPVHILTRRRLPRLATTVSLRPRVAATLSELTRRSTLVTADHSAAVRELGG